MTDDKTGRRPTSRTPARLEDALTRAEAERAAPSLAEFKRHLQAVTGHKRTPNVGHASSSRPGFRSTERFVGLSMMVVKRDSVGCEAKPWARSGGVRPDAELAASRRSRSALRASASSWSRQACSASSTLVRISEARSWKTSFWRRESVG